ncbi:aldehyde ferredoxin oxidoreductase [Candidatus Bathyarchaeota archaeon]|nr:aldehyde ferredoxin oxidoreductase [Candidatus Bathyarchaeota archaeon]
MTYGYTGKIAEVDLSISKISDLHINEKILKEYVGGRGLGVKILWDRLGSKWQTIDPLGPDNLLLALTGPLTGYIYGMRICCTGKSPLSNGIVGSTAAGEFPMELKCAGYDGIIVKGKSETPVYLLVTDDGVEIRDASKLWGLDGKNTIKEVNKEVRELLQKRKPNYGLWKEPALLYIGQAGENLVRNAAIMQKWTHACGYGGYGAVMGSKNLKALVAKGTGKLPDVYDQKMLTELIHKCWSTQFSNPQERNWGTASMGYSTGAQSSAEPVRNWQEEWHNKKSMGIVQYETRNWVKRFWSDYGCCKSCMKISVVKVGPLKGAITDSPDYELEAYCGTNLGIFDPDGVVYMSSLIDDVGMSGINSANTIGFAAELFQRGILTKEDFDGIEPRWGDPQAMTDLVKLIVERRGIGNILAEGTYRAAIEISKMKNVDALQYAIQYKGIEVGAHGIRTGSHFPYLGYALSVQGGDHTSIPRPPMSEARSAIGDSLVYCTISGPSGLRNIEWDFYKAVTGWDMNAEEWTNINGRRIIQIQRAVLLLGGPDLFWEPEIHDDNPPRWYIPLPSGPFKGSAPNRDQLMIERKDAYEAMGWDEKGIPTSTELKSLGLEDVDEALKKLRI